MNAHLPRFLAVVALATVAFTRPADANAPAGRYVVTGGGADAGTGNGTVYDTKTKLTWQQAVAPGTYTWAGAKTYCAGLSLNGTGWRLPTCKELQTIVDDSQMLSSIDATAFPETLASYFWSSSPYAGESSIAWHVGFSFGITNINAVSNTDYVRCVR